jgi:ferredoxin
MSKVKSVQSLYFSPTGGTKKILSMIHENTGLKTAPPIDLTPSGNRRSFNGRIEGDLLLVGTPVYAGTIPHPFWESLQQLDGEGKWAVPVAVHGNRAPDSTIEELAKLLRGRGFKILAAASFISKHSFASKEHPWAVGRPDEADMSAAGEFGKQICDKLSSDPSEIQVSGLLQDWFSKAMVEERPTGYHRNVLAGAKSLWWASASDKAACTKCGGCVGSCPTDSIDAETLEIDDVSCIRCMACVDACPVGVMNLVYSDKPEAQGVYVSLDKVFATRREPKLFL